MIRNIYKLELSVSRVPAFTYLREVNIRIYKTVYLKNPYPQIIIYVCMYIHVFTYSRILVFYINLSQDYGIIILV